MDMDHESIRKRVLDFYRGWRSEHGPTPAPPAPLYKAVGLKEQDAAAAVYDLDRDGLVEITDEHSWTNYPGTHYTARITADGIDYLASGQTRRVLEWFREMGPKGVESNKSDLSTVISRAQGELGMTPEDAAEIFTMLKKRGYIETVNLNPRFTGIYNTHLSESGNRFLEGSTSGTTVNVHGRNIGAIQTGTSATANVIMRINPTMNELISALDKFREAIASEQSVDNENALALVDRAKGEATSAKPNPAVMKSLLSAIPTTIQMTAALQPAYEVLKAAAQAFGLQLP